MKVAACIIILAYDPLTFKVKTRMS